MKGERSVRLFAVLATTIFVFPPLTLHAGAQDRSDPTIHIGDVSTSDDGDICHTDVTVSFPLEITDPDGDLVGYVAAISSPHVEGAIDTMNYIVASDRAPQGSALANVNTVVSYTIHSSNEAGQWTIHANGPFTSARTMGCSQTLTGPTQK